VLAGIIVAACYRRGDPGAAGAQLCEKLARTRGAFMQRGRGVGVFLAAQACEKWVQIMNDPDSAHGRRDLHTVD
jgi:hypothetical protein